MASRSARSPTHRRHSPLPSNTVTFISVRKMFTFLSFYCNSDSQPASHCMFPFPPAPPRSTHHFRRPATHSWFNRRIAKIPYIARRPALYYEYTWGLTATRRPPASHRYTRRPAATFASLSISPHRPTICVLPRKRASSFPAPRWILSPWRLATTFYLAIAEQYNIYSNFGRFIWYSVYWLDQAQPSQRSHCVFAAALSTGTTTFCLVITNITDKSTLAWSTLLSLAIRIPSTARRYTKLHARVRRLYCIPTVRARRMAILRSKYPYYTRRYCPFHDLYIHCSCLRSFLLHSVSQQCGSFTSSAEVLLYHVPPHFIILPTFIQRATDTRTYHNLREGSSRITTLL